ncbi:MAG: alpha/beta hydrolase [Panacagrimonas sp.]
MKYQQSQTDECITLEPELPAVGAVIWLHGLGADGFDFVPIVPELGLPDHLPLRFLFPHAPIRPVTINNGAKMRAWYDILSLTSLDRADEAGVRESQARVHAMIAEQNAQGIASDRIVLAGFSQGGAITLHTGLRFPQKLAGMLALSTYLPLHQQAKVEARPERVDTPILMCHGTHDPMLPVQLGEASRDAVRGLGFKVEWESYPMQHQVCMEEIQRIGAWLQAVCRG